HALPNIDRDFSSYILTLPGISDTRNAHYQIPAFAFRQQSFAAGTIGGSGNDVTIDRGENVDGRGKIRAWLSPETVREISVQRNSFPAEWGFTSQASADFVTNTGSNTLHVDGYI